MGSFIKPNNRNITVYYLITILYNAWFIEAVWYFYWARFISYETIGLLFSISNILWILADIPTGAFADRFGRKTSVIIGFILQTGSAISIALAHSVVGLAVGIVIGAIGRAFISGALEALVYDDLKAQHREHEFSGIVSKKSQLAIIAFMIAVPIGGFLYPISYRLPNILFAVSYFFAFMVALFLKEPRFSVSKEKSSRTLGLTVGFRQLFQTTLKPMSVLVILYLSLSFFMNWGLSKPAIATQYGFDSRGQSILYTLMALVSTVVLGYLPRIRSIFSDLRGVVSMIAIMALGFLLSMVPLGYYGAIILLMLEIPASLSDAWSSAIINTQIESRYRATTLSTALFIGKIPLLFSSFIMGKAIDAGNVQTFHGITGALTIGLLLWILHTAKTRKVVNIHT